MNKFWQIYAWGTILIAFAFLVLIGYWLLYPYKVIEFKNEPFTPLEETVKAGETVSYYVEYCKYMDVSAETTIIFVDGIVFSTPSFTNNWEVGCHTKLVHLPIPEELPCGKYSVQVFRSFKVNPIRKMEYMSNTAPIYVTR